MKNKLIVEFLVGIFMLLGVVALAFLALKVSGLTLNKNLFGSHTYKIFANFDNIGSLKVRSPVRVAGVEIGTVSAIVLDATAFQARVTMKIENSIADIPTDSSARITSAGLLGDDYVSISPGYAEKFLQPDGVIQMTYAATNITNLLSTFSGSFKPGGNKSSDSDNNTPKE